MRRIIPFIPLVVLLALGVLFATYGLHHDPQVEPNALIGHAAPTTAYPPLDGGVPVRATGPLNGRPGLINVFGSWCGPCAVEAPQLMQLKQDGVNIVGVTWRDRPGDTHAFLDRTGNPFSQVLNGGEGAAVDFGITGAPETFVVDSHGKVVDKRVGPITDEDVPALVKKLGSLG